MGKDCDYQQDYDASLANKSSARHNLDALDYLHVFIVGLGVLYSYGDHKSSEVNYHNGCHKYKLSQSEDVCNVPQHLPLLFICVMG